MVALAGASFLISGQLRVTSLRQNQAEAIMLAHAGVMQAIYDFRFNDPTVGGSDTGFRLGEYAVPNDTGVIGSYADDDVFVLGGQAADFLLVAMIPAGWNNAVNICGGAGNRQRLQAWTIRNVLLTSSTAPTPPDNLPDGMPVVVDQLVISWSPDNGERVYRVDLMGNANVVYNSCVGAASGTPIDLVPNQTIPPNPNAATPNRIWFSRRTTENNPLTLLMTNKNWIEIQFIMTDGPPPSIRRVRFVPGAPTASSASFTIKSVGEVRKGMFPFSAWRRIQAEYRLDDDDTSVSSLQEVGSIASDQSPVVDRPGYRELNQRQP